MNNQLREIPSTDANQRKNRPTIGFFVIEIGAWNLWPWQGIMDTGRQHDVNLVTYVGRIVALDPAVLGWRFVKRLWSGMAGGFGSRVRACRVRAPHSISPYLNENALMWHFSKQAG